MSTSKPIQLQKLAMKPANPKILSKSLAGTSVFVSYPDPEWIRSGNTSWNTAKQLKIKIDSSI